MIYYGIRIVEIPPYLYAEYAGDEAIISIKEGRLLAGYLLDAQLKLVLAYLEMHREELRSGEVCKEKFGIDFSRFFPTVYQVYPTEDYIIYARPML